MQATLRFCSNLHFRKMLVGENPQSPGTHVSHATTRHSDAKKSRDMTANFYRCSCPCSRFRLGAISKNLVPFAAGYGIKINAPGITHFCSEYTQAGNHGRSHQNKT